ncbi:MAG: oligopeptide transporter, OPT family [Bacteroidota bacterium]
MEKPYIDANTSLPEITVKAIIIGSVLSIVLSAANAYFGLFAGLTVSASIPAAVISMALLKVFKNSNILENNLVQTAASAGESLAAGVIFTIPALVIMGYWQAFNYFETVTIALCGGVLGVLFTIPLRKALIIEENLKFPEGVATAEVLKTGKEGGKSVKYLVQGSLIGGAFKLGDAALNLWEGTWQKATLINEKIYAFFGLNLSPALIAVGYIVGLNISFLLFFGGAISWFIAIPIYIVRNGVQEGVDAITLGGNIWNTQIRYLGVGAMVVGGLWALLSLSGSLGTAFRAGLDAFKKGGEMTKNQIRTELDTPMSWVLIGIGVLIVPIFLIYQNAISDVPVTVTMTLVMVVAGFLFAAVAGYMAGLVGSSNNPISGVTIATILSASLLLLTLMKTGNELDAAAAAILVGAVVSCAAAIAADNMQDLKAGHMLGATPYKQQIMQIVGVVSGAIAIPLVLNSLLLAYGMGAPTLQQPDSLSAPQATLMQSVAQGIFGGGLPWNMVSIGAGIGVTVIVIDQYLKSKNSQFRMPVLAVAVGIYLPFELNSAIFLGGIIAWALDKATKKSKGREKSVNAGLLLASGLITGEALMGIFIAIAIAAFGFKKLPGYDAPGIYENIGLGILLVILFFIYKQVISVAKKDL